MCSELEFSQKKVSEWVVAKCFCVQFGLFWVKSSGRTRVIETAHMSWTGARIYKLCILHFEWIGF